jgi:hypothetical protein
VVLHAALSGHLANIFLGAGAHLSLFIYSGILSAGGFLVWLLALKGTQTEVIVSDAGLSMEFMRQRLWFVPWERFLCWRWQRDLFGRPLGIIVYQTSGWPRHLRLGLLGVGWYRRGIVYPNPYYVALLKALSQYVWDRGEAWQEPPVPRKKGW